MTILHEDEENRTIDEVLINLEFCDTEFHCSVNPRHGLGVNVEEANRRKGKAGNYSTEYYKVERRWNYGRDILIFPMNSYKIVYAFFPKKAQEIAGGDRGILFSHGDGIQDIAFNYNGLKFFIGLNERPKPNWYDP